MEHHLETPVPEKEIRNLQAGDLIYVTGTVITARDEAHLKALELHEKGKAPPVDFKGNGVFHCGPILQAPAWRSSKTSSSRYTVPL